MSDEEDYSSADDEDYVPSDKEGLSEEDESGEEEDLTVLQEGKASENRAATGKGKRKKTNSDLMPRKRRGGIKLDGEDEKGETTPEQDEENKQLKEEIVKEQEAAKAEKEKKSADDLWASFLSDVGQKPKPKSTSVPSAGSLGSLTSVQSKPKTTQVTANGGGTKPSTAASQKITVTKTFDFAGEEVKVKEEVDVQSKEGQKELRRLEEETSDTEKKESVLTKPVIGRILGQAPPTNSSPKSAGGLGSVLGKIGKKNKISVLNKSKLDWDSYKKDEGIEEDLKIHNRGKDGYIERMAFLQRTDVRQFEIEKNMRQSSSKR